MDVPDDFHPLLASTAVAVVSTTGPGGRPQAAPTWFTFDAGSGAASGAGQLRFSLVDGRQRPRNLRRDPRVSVLVIDPARPTYYAELRGRVTLTKDPHAELERAVSVEYTGDWADAEAPGTMRYAVTVEVERVTGQRGHGQEAPAAPGPRT